MDIKKIVLIGITVVAPLFITAHASYDICSEGPGHWQGIYTLKNQQECQAYNGCTHMVMADVDYISENNYHLSLNPVVGEGYEFTIHCRDGVISSPIPESTAKISCKHNHCSVVYEDPRLTSEMLKS